MKAGLKRFTAMVLLQLCAALWAAAPTVAPPSARDFAGFWKNTHEQAGFIKFLDIQAVDSHRLRIHAWLRCNPSAEQVGTIRDCQDWGVDEIGAFSFDTVTWEHAELVDAPGEAPRLATWTSDLSLSGETLKVSTRNTNWDNFFQRAARPRRMPPALWKAQACARIGNIAGEGPVTCEGPQGQVGGGRSGTTFPEGKVFVLLRFRGLSPGRHQVRTQAYRQEGTRYRRRNNRDQRTTFRNQSRAWAQWFEARGRERGNWRLEILLDGVWRGWVTYCYKCRWLEE